jgi:hypothetical protein
MPRTARFGAIWILGMGVLISALLVYGFVSSRWACGESGSSFACDLSNIAVVIGAGVACLHLIVGASIWRGQLRGVAVGAVITSLGLLACLLLVDNEPWWLVLPFAAGYLATSLALALTLIAGLRKRGPA